MPVVYSVIQMIDPVTTKPTMAQINNDWPVKVTPGMAPKPTSRYVMYQMAPSESTAEAMKPLYSAPMIDFLRPSPPKKVPAIDVMMQAPPMPSG